MNVVERIRAAWREYRAAQREIERNVALVAQQRREIEEACQRERATRH